MQLVIALIFVLAVCNGEYSTPSAIQSNVANTNSKRDTCVGCYLLDSTQFPDYGTPSGSDAFPNYHERTTLTWYNMVRMDPQHFLSTWLSPQIRDSSGSNIFTSGSFPAVPGLPWNLNLNRASRAHCSDRSTCPGAANPHNDCNGTTTTDRLNKFYNGWRGEIYWEYSYLGTITTKTWPFFAVAGWICDGSLWSDGTYQSCAADGSAGHRSIIMTAGSEVGCGTLFSGNTVWATCNEGSGQVYTSQRILTGSHVFSPTSANSLFFMANFYHSSETVTSAVAIVDGSSVSLSLESGTSSAGTWKSAAMATGSGCRTYVFQITTSSGTYVYPTSGSFSTYGEGSCTVDFNAGSSSTVAAATTGSGITSTTAPGSTTGTDGSVTSGTTGSDVTTGTASTTGSSGYVHDYVVADSDFPAYGVPSGSDGFPNYYERSILTWYNLVRMAPIDFKSNWLTSIIKDASADGIFSGNSYPATSGITWNLNLNRAARAHCSDRSSCPNAANPHDDCNGTSTNDRLNKFYDGWSGEIYWEYPYLGTITTKTWPFFAVAGWICDGSLWSDGTYQGCAADDSGADGHRSNIMTSGTEVGCGTIFSDDGSTVWSTCDEGSGQVYTSQRVMSGSHMFDHRDANSMFFMAAFYNSDLATNNTVVSANVILDGTSYPMNLESGSASAGTWVSDAMTVGSTCRQYYFQFQLASGSTDVYPSVGDFYTFGEGDCVQDYVNNNSNGTPNNSSDNVSTAFRIAQNIAFIVISLLICILL